MTKSILFPAIHPYTLSVLKQWGFTLDPEYKDGNGLTIRLYFPQGWKIVRGYGYIFDLVDDQGEIKGHGEVSSCGGYFIVEEKFRTFKRPNKLKEFLTKKIF
jgi:hypothetical protein